MRKILFVEDNDEYREMLAKLLKEAGYHVDTAQNALQGIEHATLSHYDLIISDLSMDVIDGLQFLEHVKRKNSSVKTMLLTGKPSMDSELTSLDICVDKYLVKEIRKDVLLKHIEQLFDEENYPFIKRKNIYVVKEENLIMDIAQRQVTINDEEIHLTPNEFLVLEILLKNKGRAIRRKEIMKVLHEKSKIKATDRNVDAYIKKLRHKLDTSKILSIRGYGYRWDNE